MYPPTIISVHGLHLAAGDVVRLGNRCLTIVEIGEPFLDMRRGTQRHSQVVVNGVGEPTPFTFKGFSLVHFVVVGGPKVDAVRRDRTLIKRMPAGYWLWQGGVA